MRGRSYCGGGAMRGAMREGGEGSASGLAAGFASVCHLRARKNSLLTVSWWHHRARRKPSGSRSQTLAGQRSRMYVAALRSQQHGRRDAAAGGRGETAGVVVLATARGVGQVPRRVTQDEKGCEQRHALGGRVERTPPAAAAGAHATGATRGTDGTATWRGEAGAAAATAPPVSKVGFSLEGPSWCKKTRHKNKNHTTERS